jgi:hypothetical protein
MTTFLCSKRWPHNTGLSSHLYYKVLYCICFNYCANMWTEKIDWGWQKFQSNKHFIFPPVIMADILKSVCLLIVTSIKQSPVFKGCHDIAENHSLTHCINRSCHRKIHMHWTFCKTSPVLNDHFSLFQKNILFSHRWLWQIFWKVFVY